MKARGIAAKAAGLNSESRASRGRRRTTAYEKSSHYKHHRHRGGRRPRRHISSPIRGLYFGVGYDQHWKRNERLERKRNLGIRNERLLARRNWDQRKRALFVGLDRRSGSGGYV